MTANRRIKFDFKSIRFKLWLYFALLSFVVVGLIWLLQVALLNSSYEDMKIEEVQRIGASLSMSFENGDENFTSKIQEMSVSNDMYVMMESNEKILVFSPDQESALPVYKYKNELPKLKSMLMDPRITSKSVSYKFSTNYEKYSTLAYASLVHSNQDFDAILYIFSPLYPVSSTISILKEQLLNVTIISMLLAFLLALFFARRISSPIKQMTLTAKQMSTGDYSVKYEGSSYSEINDLANTLNLTAYELGKLDEHQKDIVANVSHDLKTPLTMIKSYAEMIMDISGDDPEKRNKHLNVIIEESDRMANLVSDMSNVTAMQRNTIKLEKSYFDISSLTATILSTYEIYQDQQNYDFQFSMPKETAMVFADESKIKQVITNLISNAVKYCGDDMVVIVNIKKLGRKYRVEVSDHGPGISPEELPHIWDRYYKTSTNYARPTEGTGLGLSIVKGILTLHHAQYGVISKVGKGTTFWFELDLLKQ